MNLICRFAFIAEIIDLCLLCFHASALEKTVSEFEGAQLKSVELQNSEEKRKQ